MATKHKRIYVGRPRPLDYEKFQKYLSYLQRWVRTADYEKLVQILREIVPGYRPSEEWLKENAR